MAAHRITYAGPAGIALDVVTALADADGVELTSSSPPSPLSAGTVALDVTVQGSESAVTGAVQRIQSNLPAGARIEVANG